MMIYFASDHAGFALKQILLAYVRDELGHLVEDCGAFVYEPEDDYPDSVSLAAKKVSDAEGDARAIILGGSGQGEAMVANRYPNVRATVYYGGPDDIITLSREHNNANVLSLGARFLKEDEAKSAVTLWLSTPWSNDERHVRRIAKF